MTFTQEQMKTAAARAALEYARGLPLIGVGSGTTVNHFIALLGTAGFGIEGPMPKAAVAASVETRRRLEAVGVHVVSLGEAGHPPLYIDGADEIDSLGRMIKGGGGAHTLEKRVASASRTFLCIVDASKVVEHLGEGAPVPLEVLPEATGSVCDAVREIGGTATVRPGARTDLGNLLVDAYGLDLADPDTAEVQLDAIAGVVECGLFARRRADVVIVGEPDGSVRERIPSEMSPPVLRPQEPDDAGPA